MIKRPFWINKIKTAWKSRTVVWLSGVRRVGKTTISKMLDNAIYENCDLPSVARKLEDPETYFESLPENQTVIFDEIHRLEDPSMILKIAADEYPKLKILATGSSSLEATQKFKDSLTGRKSVIYLPPVLWDETRNLFGIKNLDERLLRGGLPEPLLSKNIPDEFYSEWIDSFYARDIQELFNVRNRKGFLQLMRLLFRSSGNLTETTQLSKMSGLTRPTVLSYLEAMRIANLIFMLPPFHGGGRRELTQRPKYYCFDTGFVSFIHGWNEIRENDRGLLWEHVVLDLLRSRFPDHQLFYWRDKSNREIDFVIKKPGNTVDIIECKINPDHLSTNHLKTFREFYPGGKNFCFSPFIKKPWSMIKNGIKIYFTGTVESLI